MRTTAILGLTALVLAALLVGGCENTELTAPSDGVIVLAANPNNVDFNPDDPNQERDPDTGEMIARSTIIAQIFDADGLPQENVGVVFTTSGGSLASGSTGSIQTVRTNANGIATDVLTLTESQSALQQVEVSARSAALSETVTVFINRIAPDAAPFAVISTNPMDVQGVGRPVIFDGTASFDPDDTDRITMYRWTITSTNPDPGKPNPEILEGPGVSGFDRSFQNVQELTVSLEVSSDPAAPLLFANGDPVPYSANVERIGYQIQATACQDLDNQAPTAVIAGPDQITAPLAGGGTGTQIQFDGSLSSDPDGVIEDYVWNCGNNTTPTPLPGQIKPVKVICRYSLVGTYTATLQVRDNGTGVIDPVTGTWRCQKVSQRDEVQVTITVPQ